MKNKHNNLPLILMILDGFGYGAKDINNAIHLANPKFINSLFDKCGFGLLGASGESVGLPDGQMGNSEVGHLTIGSGRILYQDLVRINKAIQNNEIVKNQIFKDFIHSIKRRNNICHVVGMLSKGGVHSHEDHIIHFIFLLLKEGIKVKCHFFLDGRDTDPICGVNSLNKVSRLFDHDENFELSTISGRYYAMDRDKNYNRIEKVYNAIFKADGIKSNGNQTHDMINCVTQQNNQGVSDEFILPIVNKNYSGFNHDDSIITLNWRSDRMIQLLHTIGDKNFNEFKRPEYCDNIITLTEYSNTISKFSKAIFSKQSISNTLGDIIEKNNLKQLRIAETEKYAHVTFFFDGGKKKEIKDCKEVLIKSPSVATYDLQPEMSAEAITDELIKEIDNFDVFILNFANLDMVGHTGNIDATIKSVKTIDNCVKRIIDEFDKRNGISIITADHGNADEMFDKKTLTPKTSHTLNPVPFCIVTKEREKFSFIQNGSLQDIAPTILKLLNIEKPCDMTGKILFK
jgi:2,3-bisphosphoglycerate-independent phosphoglycerate mutase